MCDDLILTPHFDRNDEKKANTSKFKQILLSFLGTIKGKLC